MENTYYVTGCTAMMKRPLPRQSAGQAGSFQRSTAVAAGCTPATFPAYRVLWHGLFYGKLHTLLTALIMVLAMYLGSCNAEKQPPADDSVYYTCSMDPQVIEYKPGKCPICRMELTPVMKSNGGQSDEIMLSEQQVKLGNIRTDTVRKGSISDQVVLTATLNFNQLTAIAVSARVSGRIEKLYYKIPGDYIKKGDPLYDIYSEELNNAKQEYLLALDRRLTFANDAVISFDQLLEGARHKLLLWGMQEAQVKELETSRRTGTITTFYSPVSGYATAVDIREGDYVMEGNTIATLADLSSLWAEAQVYTSQLAVIDHAGKATVELPDFEGKTVTGKLEFVNPEINPDTRINLIRVAIPNPGNQLRPGMPAYVILDSRPSDAITLPVDAVLRDGKGATAWIWTGPNTFKNVMVQTGLESGDRIAILSGLNPGDIAVVSGAYLLNSEYIFKKGADPMAAHNH